VNQNKEKVNYSVHETKINELTSELSKTKEELETITEELIFTSNQLTQAKQKLLIHKQETVENLSLLLEEMSQIEKINHSLEDQIRTKDQIIEKKNRHILQLESHLQ